MIAQRTADGVVALVSEEELPGLLTVFGCFSWHDPRFDSLWYDTLRDFLDEWSAIGNESNYDSRGFNVPVPRT